MDFLAPNLFSFLNFHFFLNRPRHIDQFTSILNILIQKKAKDSFVPIRLSHFTNDVSDQENCHPLKVSILRTMRSEFDIFYLKLYWETFTIFLAIWPKFRPEGNPKTLHWKMDADGNHISNKGISRICWYKSRMCGITIKNSILVWKTLTHRKNQKEKAMMRKKIEKEKKVFYSDFYFL